MSTIAEFVYSLFDRFDYGAIFFGVMLDGAGIPVPGEIVLLLAGGMTANQSLGSVAAIVIAAAGALTIDSAWFLAGRAGSKRLVALYCHISFGSTACLAKTESNLARFGPRSLLYARFVPGFRTFAAPMAGMSGMPYRWFALYDGIGALLWATVGIETGALFAHELAGMLDGLESVQSAVLYLAAGALCMFLLMKWWIRRRHGSAEPESMVADASLLHPSDTGDAAG